MVKKSVFFLLALLLFSCNNSSKINGLWTVQNVIVGERSMTPNGRWMRFNADSTQQSGNGWYQHSVGTWQFSPQTNELEVFNSNGYEDPYEPFKVSFSNDTMIWKRMEEGREVRVILSRASELPQTYGDQLLGLWDLEESQHNGEITTNEEDPNQKRYIFFRWDKRFVIQHTPEGTVTGVCNVNGHQPEMTWIFDDSNKERIAWKFDVSDEKLMLKSISPDGNRERTYKRIRQFPQ